MATLTAAGRVFTRPEAVRIAGKAMAAKREGKRLVAVSWQGHEALMPPLHAFFIAVMIENSEPESISP